MAKGKFDFLKSANYGQDEQGRIRMFSDDQIKQFNAENEAKRKIDDANKLKQQIQSETDAVIMQSQKEKAGFERMATIGKGAQAVIDPRMWARGAVGLGKMVFGQTIETTVTGGKAIGEQNAATNLYTQSKDLADQASKIVKTDRPQAESLLRQSQALIEEANKFAQGESTKKIMGADDKLTTKEIIGKSALTAIEVGSLAPIGSVAKGSFMLAKTVPPAVQGTKTVAVGNFITRALGLGDIYQVTKTGLQQGLKQEVKQTIVGQASWAAAQAPVTAGLIEMADDDGVNNYWGSLTTTGVGAFGLTLGFGYAGRVLGSAAGEVVGGVTQQLNKKSAAAVTDLTGAMPVPPAPVKPVPEPQKLLPLPQEAIQTTTEVNSTAADKLYNQANKLSARASKLTDKTKADELIKKSQDLIAQADKMPKEKVNVPLSAYSSPDLDPNVFEPKAQVIGTTVNEPLPNPYSKLGAFNPETDIPMIDITETIKPNNIDFNPDSVMSINATRKAVDDIALLNGNEVGGKKLKINTDDPKFKEIYNNKIKPLVDRINKVDADVEAPDVEIKKSYEVQFNEKEKVFIYRGEKYDTYNELAKAETKRYNEIIKKENPEDLEELSDAYFKFRKNLNNKRNLTSEQIAFVKKIDKEVYEGNTMSELISKEVGKKIETSEDLEKLSKKLGKEKVQELNDKFKKEASDKIDTAWQKFYEKNYKTAVDKVADVSAQPQPTVEKVPVEDVEMEVQKIYSELENAGLNITPEQVRYTPNIQAVDEKLAKGETLTPEEFDKGMQEYVNSTGKTEVIDGVREELINPMRKSTYVEKLKKQNPDLNIESVQYEAAIVKDLEEKAINLIETNFDEAGRIAKNITKSSNPEQVKVAELYMEKLRELGKNDELAQILHRFGKASSQAGQWNGILRPHKMGTPEYAIKQAQDARINKLKPQVEKQVAKVKQQMSSVKVDQTFLSDILDNITCR